MLIRCSINELNRNAYVVANSLNRAFDDSCYAEVFGERFIFSDLSISGDYDKARRYAEQQNPEFAADANPEVDAFNVSNVIAYAFLLQQDSENQRADALLEMALPVVRSLPRVGLSGHGIRDVQILALQGKTSDALAAFRDAVDEGFRGTVASNGWPLVADPYLSSLRGQPAFEVMVDELDDAISTMQQRVADTEQSGDWDALRALVERP